MSTCARNDDTKAAELSAIIGGFSSVGGLTGGTWTGVSGTGTGGVTGGFGGSIAASEEAKAAAASALAEAAAAASAEAVAAAFAAAATTVELNVLSGRLQEATAEQERLTTVV